MLSNKNDESTLAECLNNLATVHMDLGNLSRAERLYLDAIAIDRTLDDAEAVIMDLNNLGNVYLKIGQATGKPEYLEISLAYLKESLAMLQAEGRLDIKTKVLNNIGALYYFQGDYEMAKLFFNEGLEISKSADFSKDEATFTYNLGLLAFQKDEVAEAISLLKAAVRVALEANHPDVLWEAYFGLGLCYERFEDRVVALQLYKSSIDTIEQMRKSVPHDIFKIGFTKNRIAPYQKIIDLLYAIYNTNPTEDLLQEMFRVTEHAKAQAFLEGIEKEITNLRPNRVDEGPLQSEGSRIFSVSEIQNALLDDRSVLLEYFLGERRSYIFSITKRDLRIDPIADQDKIETSLKAYLKYISSSPGLLPEVRAASQRIGRELLFPLEGLLDQGIDTIIVIPDGMLTSLPFETLSIGNSQTREYLIERYKVHYGPSASSLIALKNRKDQDRYQKALLAYGGPLYDQGKGQGLGIAAAVGRKNPVADRDRPLSSLPFSKQEVEEIARAFPGHLRDIYLGEEAIEENIKKVSLRGYQIIHFAGHGFADRDNPFRSALILSYSSRRREDGYLRMDEIGQLAMNADLVVLSACQTGTGALERSEGFLSLSRMFFYAGARSVLASLWPVSDKTTTNLMKHFYSYFLQGNDTCQALRLAKLELLHSDKTHPLYWAGFVLSGLPAWIMEMR